MSNHEGCTFDDTVQRAATAFERRCPYGNNPFGIYSERVHIQNPRDAPESKVQEDTYGDVYQGTTQVGRRVAAKMLKEMSGMGNVTYGDVDKEIKTSSESCSVCMKKTETMKRCSRCKNVRYCSVECQKEDWIKQHKEVCASIKLLE